MSITRFGYDNSDVYVYVSDQGVECCGCLIHDRESTRICLKTGAEMIAHLRKHQEAGHHVPDHAFTELAKL